MALDPAVLGRLAAGAIGDPAAAARLAARTTGAERVRYLTAAAAARPVDPAGWLALGQARWKLAVAAGDDADRAAAQELLDWGRCLAWPWPGQVPLVDWERSRASPVPADDRRRRTLAWLSRPTSAPGYVAEAVALAEGARSEASPAAGFWMGLAVARRLGDRELAVRLAEQITARGWGALPGRLVEGDLRVASRAALAAQYADLADRAGRQGDALAALLDPILGPLLASLPAAGVPLAVARQALDRLAGGARLRRPIPVIIRATTIFLRHRESGGAALLERLPRITARIPSWAQDVVALATDPARPMPRQPEALLAAAQVASALPDAARARALGWALSACQQLPSAGRLAVTLACLAAARGLAPYGLEPLLGQAVANWSSAAAHDRALLAVVDCRLSDPDGLPMAAGWCARADQDLGRGRLEVRLARARGAAGQPERARELATAALERLGGAPPSDPAAWGVRAEAARVLLHSGDAAGREVLGALVDRGRGRPRALAAPLTAGLRALREAAAAGDEAAAAVAAELATWVVAPPGYAWLVAGPGRVRHDREPREAGRALPGRLVATLDRDAPGQAWLDRLREAVEPVAAMAPYGPDRALVEALTAAATAADGGGLGALDAWTTGQADPVLLLAGLALANAGLDGLVAAAGRRQAAAIDQAVRQALLDRLQMVGPQL